MATVKLADIEGMMDKEPISKTERLALELLEVFGPDRPLDQEEFEEWIEINSLSAEEIKQGQERPCAGDGLKTHLMVCG